MVVSAEISNHDIYLDAHEIITRSLAHGRCDAKNSSAPCTEDGKCTKRYIRAIVDQMSTNTSGYPVYRLRDDGRFLVDATAKLCRTRFTSVCKYDAHINVEVSLT